MGINLMPRYSNQRPRSCEIGAFVLAAPLRVIRPAMEWYKVLTAGMLPEPVRQGFGFRFGRSQHHGAC